MKYKVWTAEGVIGCHSALQAVRLACQLCDSSETMVEISRSNSLVFKIWYTSEGLIRL